jgi:putative transposase
MKFSFIAEQSGVFPVKRLCQVLAVSASGYYSWRGRPPSRRARANAELAKHIQEA